ncbi:MAG: hypothetical protein KA604_00025 [Candidatus Saccharimonas sp.]|nr:hypothetical protein [Candidatus Saccharimonas sp.]
MDNTFLLRFAVTYDCNAYGASTYNNDEPCQTTATSGNSSASGGLLSSTGTDIFIGIGAGLLLIILGVVLLRKLRRTSKR